MHRSFVAPTSSLREHGPVVRIRTGPTPAYVVTDPALTRKVLVTDAAHYAKGGKIIDVLRVFFGDGLATIADGDAHLRNRRLMQPMFNKAHIAGRGDAMIEQVAGMVGAWPEAWPRDVYEDMNEVTLAAFLVALFGVDLPEHLEGEFTALMPEIMKGTIRQTILPGHPAAAARQPGARAARRPSARPRRPGHRPPCAPGGRLCLRRRSGPGRRRMPARGGPRGTDRPLRHPADRRGPADPPTAPGRGHHLLTGAIETTGTTLAWTLYEISRHPRIERRLPEELATVCGDRPLRYGRGHGQAGPPDHGVPP
jgi:pentalenene oxygenase